MGRTKWLGRLFLACVLAWACAAPPLLAATASVDLWLDPPSAQVNTFLIGVTATAMGTTKSDTDTTTLTGDALATLTFGLDPLTCQAAVTGLEFTGGRIAMSDSSFVLDYGWLLGKINATGQGISGTLDTPVPPGSVSGGTFPAEQHSMILDQGTFNASGTGFVGTLFEPISENLAVEPIIAAAEGIGQLSVVLAGIVGHSATYGVTMALPVDFQQRVLEDPVLVDVTGTGTLRATGQFTLQVPDPASTDWTGSADDRWEESGNWTTVVAPGPGSAVVFDAVAPHPPTLHQAESVAGVKFHTARWTILGSSTLTIGAVGITSAGAGANTIAPPVAMAANSTWTTAAGNTLAVTGDVTGGSRTLVKSGAGTLVLGKARGLNGLTLSAGRLELLAGGTGILATRTLSISPGATLDIADNALIVNYSVVANPCAQVAAWVASGLRGGPTGWWDGTGMTSSAAAAEADKLTAVGLLDNADPDAGGKTAFAGETVDATSLLIMYTWWGDANLDGVVDANDYDIIDRGFLFTPNPATPWYTGDFNYDGAIDANDYDRIDKAFLFQTGPLAGGPASPTPEPATMALLGLGAAMALLRRKRA